MIGPQDISPNKYLGTILLSFNDGKMSVQEYICVPSIYKLDIDPWVYKLGMALPVTLISSFHNFLTPLILGITLVSMPPS